MAQVRELFSDLFAYVLLFEQTHLLGEFQPSYEQVRRDIAALLEQQKAAAKRQGTLEQDYHDACFAVVAWADETILKHSTWKHHNQWNAFPLQVEYYDTRNAGEEFFERLDKLRSEQKEVREVYYLCLGLGFSGRYFLGLEDERKLNQIRHDQAQHLTLPVADVQDIDKITSQPYQVTPPEGRPITRPLTQLLLVAGLALLIIVPLVLILTYGMRSSTPPVEEVRPEKAKPEEKAKLEEKVKQWLDTHTEILPCAKVFVASADGQTGIVNLAGRVVSQTQSAAVREGIRNIQGVTQVNDTSQIIPRPFCDVLDLLEPFKKRGEEQGFGLLANLGKQGTPPTYLNGENFVMGVRTPTKFESYVYVDYYSTDETVGHLFPNSKEAATRFGPNGSLTVGRPDGPHPWLITPPFGQDLVTVIASKMPLFSTPRPDPGERAEAYINALRQALPKDVSKSEVAATFYFIKTQAQP
jgi:type IV/VI secretion system ImpK/VasF family protein